MNNNSGNNLTDKHLVDRILGGDAAVFGIVIKSTEKLVAQIVFKMISNAEDRKDIAQDIYLKAYKNLGAFRFQSKLSTWIAQISYNTCLDYLRKKRLVLPGNDNEEGDTDDNTLDRLSQSTSIRTESERLIFQKDLSGILKTEIEKLSPVYKTLITLYHQEELSYEEMAEITGLHIGTIKSYLFRARKKMKENLLLNYKKKSYDYAPSYRG